MRVGSSIGELIWDATASLIEFFADKTAGDAQDSLNRIKGG